MEDNRQEKRTLTASNMGIICPAIGIVASIVVIILNFIDNESLTLGISLLCACSILFIANINQKNNKKES